MADQVLTPELALDYIGELSTDIRAAVVLDRDGRLAAGTPDVGERLREPVVELMKAAAPARQVEVKVAGGAVFAVHGEDWTVAAVTRRSALSSLMFYDLRSALAALGAASS